MNKVLVIALIIYSSIVTAESYTAIISCGMQGNHLNIAACFDGTDLKITKDGNTRLYKIYELQSAGQTHRDGLHIDLPSSFSIKAQNSHKTLVLGVKILDENGVSTFEDQAGKWDVIWIGN